MTELSLSYPARLTVDFPEGSRRRGSVFARLIIAVPVIIMLSLVSGEGFDYSGDWGSLLEDIDWLLESDTGVFPFGVVGKTMGAEAEDKASTWNLGAISGGVLFLPTLLTLLFVRRYPRWWFDWHLALVRFEMRIIGFLFLLRDEYPALEEEQAVHLDLDYPDAATELGRGMPLVKWLLAFPHCFCLAALVVAALICTVLAWFAILFTGRHPRGLFDFVVAVLRWGFRVEAYALLLTTDRYPPFSLAE